MNKEVAKSIAIKALQKIYGTYSGKGLLAIYLWGSSTRDDFDPATSDIDVIGITDDSFDPSNRKLIKEQLETESPQIKEFGFQNVFLSELNGGPRRSVLMKLQAPGYLLKSFHEWQWVCGEHFERQDFSEPDFSVEQMIDHNLSEADRALSSLDDPGRKPNANRIDLVKALLMLIYWRSVKGGNKKRLDLTNLPEVALDSDRTAAATLLDMRKNKTFSGDAFAHQLPELIRYLETARSNNSNADKVSS